MTQDYYFVLISGLLREARHWGEFAGYLQQNFPGASTETPNIPGNGYLNYLTSPNTVADMTEALRRQVGKRQRFTLIAILWEG